MGGYAEGMATRGAYAKGVVKREEILQAALAAVAEHGYRKASVREIADAAGLSPAGLLHYFGTKEELFVAILRARDARDEQEYAGEDVVQAFLAITRHNASVPGLVQLYAQLAAEAGDPEHPAHAYFRERTARVEEFTRAQVAADQAAGLVRDDLDPAWIVRTIHALADGLQSAWMLDPTIDMAAELEQFLVLLRPA
ncbi:HTH-type transcriptional repressor AcnR [Microbacterium oxydans]|nr:HTH-type transcriptional repressor AcnR [Microbacterium oxydans]